jgi:glycosyltransferase involved in cell wall biosynthesis
MRAKVVLSGEASYISSGYGVINRELGRRFHQCPDIDFIEFACYGDYSQAQAHGIPWPICCNNPSTPEEEQVYNADPLNQFGKWKFDRLLLEFGATHCVDYRDSFMIDFMFQSPYRRFFNLFIVPTVDGSPQMEEWLELYRQADGCGFYTDWGRKLVLDSGVNLQKDLGVLPPCVSYDDFYPILPKAKHKESMGLSKDSIIIGMAGRNQPRKLFPKLVEYFEAVLATLDDKKADNTYLWLHTAYPDLGWDIPRVIKDSKCAHKILFTYRCASCNHVFPDFWRDTKTFCEKCGNYSAVLPGTKTGIKTEDLNRVYNCWDIGINLALAEGIGMTQLEIAAIGLPLVCVNYSGMEDLVNKVGAIGIKVDHFYKDPPTYRDFAIPSKSDFIEQVGRLIRLPSHVRQAQGGQNRIRCQQHYNWDNVANRLIAHILETPPKAPWNSPANFVQSKGVQYAGPQLNNEFVQQALIHTAGRPDLINSYVGSRMARHLNWGMAPLGHGMTVLSDSSVYADQRKHRPYGPEEVLSDCKIMADNWNGFEKLRVERFQNG